jgi:hypothetical protein
LHYQLRILKLYLNVRFMHSNKHYNYTKTQNYNKSTPTDMYYINVYEIYVALTWKIEAINCYTLIADL